MVRQSRATAADESTREETEYAPIVDQSQFRNLEVGRGYQAPGVVRQPTAHPEVASSRKRPKKHKKDKKKHKKHKKKHASSPQKDDDDSDDDVVPQPDAGAILDDDDPVWALPRKLADFEAIIRRRLAEGS